MTEQREQVYEKKTEETKAYDEVANKVRKLLTATGASYIEELCEALKKDWYPHLTTDIIRFNDDLRDEIRDKVLNDWSKDRNPEGIWKESSITTSWFPDWLTNPEYDQMKAKMLKTKADRAREATQKKFLVEAQRQKTSMDRMARQLPETPQETPEEYQQEQEGITYSGGGREYEPEKYVPSPEELYEDIIHGYANAWYALTNKDHIPGINEDVLVDYIKPSEKHWLRIIKGLDEPRAAHLINVMTWTHMLIKRRIETWNEIRKERREIQK